MKTIKQLTFISLFLCSVFSVHAQCLVEAGVNKVLGCEGSVQLNAEPILDGVWDSIYTGMADSFNAIYFRNSNTGFVATTAGAIYKTTDGGTTWISKISGTSNRLMAIRFYDDNTGYAVGYNGTIIKTTNGGESWVALNSGTTNSLRSLCILNQTSIVIIGISTVLKSSDSGQTWTLTTLGTSLNDITFTSLNNGYICGSPGAIYQTKDGGNTWVKHLTPVTNSLNSISFVTDSIGYAAGTGNTILKVENGLMNSVQMFIPMLTPGSIIKTISFYTADYGYLTGYDAVLNSAFVFKTNDGGQNWSQVAFYPSKKSYCGSFIGLNTGYICGPSGFMAKLKVDIPANDTYSWTPTTGLNNPNIKNPIASPEIGRAHV